MMNETIDTNESVEKIPTLGNLEKFKAELIEELSSPKKNLTNPHEMNRLTLVGDAKYGEVSGERDPKRRRVSQDEDDGVFVLPLDASSVPPSTTPAILEAITSLEVLHPHNHYNP